MPQEGFAVSALGFRTDLSPVAKAGSGFSVLVPGNRTVSKPE